jgi:hypothetical protein
MKAMQSDEHIKPDDDQSMLNRSPSRSPSHSRARSRSRSGRPGHGIDLQEAV